MPRAATETNGGRVVVGSVIDVKVHYHQLVEVLYKMNDGYYYV